MSGTARPGVGLASYGDMNLGVPKGTANSSGPSMGASSLVTDANSSLSGVGPQLQRSSSVNNESYLHLPASPMSFSSNISGSSVMDGSSIVQSPQQEQMPKQGASSAMSQLMMQDPGLLPPQKRARMDMKQANHQQQVIQQMLQRHQNPQLQAMIQQQIQQQQIQQHQILQSVPQLQRMQMHQQAQVSRARPHQLVSPVSSPLESGLCARRLMQYMYHLSNRPPENSISYWRKFVAEYFAPRAKKRWCLSLYRSAGNQSLGAFPQAAMDAWQCGICGSKSGKGFEATCEVLPRLNQINFDHGVIDELLYLDMPQEGRLPSGMMVLEYAKAVEECVHEQSRVVREGHLRIIFTPDLKILCWEFCARRHEELLPRRILVHQVNQLLYVAQKYQAVVNESGPSGVSVQDLQASCNMFVAAGRHLAKNLDMQSLNDLGFSKRYVRCLQISEVVNSMKDLMDFSWSHKVGPIETLKNYSQQDSAKLQAQKVKLEQVGAVQNLPSDQSTLNKFMAMHPDHRLSGRTTCFPNNFSQCTDPLNNYEYILRNTPNPGPSPVHSDASFVGLNQVQPAPFQRNGPSTVSGQSFHDMSIKNQQQQPLQGSFALPNNNEPPSQANQHLQQRMIQRLLQDMVNKGAPQQSNHATTAKDNVKAEMVGGVGSSAADIKVAGQLQNGNSKGEISAEIRREMPSPSDNCKPATANNDSSDSNKSYNARQDVFENLNLGDFDQDILQEFVDEIQW